MTRTLSFPVPPIAMSLTLVMGFASCTLKEETAPTPARTTAKTVSFILDVKPLLESKCLACHSELSAPWGFRLESKALAFEKGLSGPRIVPGKPDQSLMVQLATVHKNYAAMPMQGSRLTEAESQMLRLWITEGADWPSGGAGQLKPAPGTVRPEYAKMTADHPSAVPLGESFLRR